MLHIPVLGLNSLYRLRFPLDYSLACTEQRSAISEAEKQFNLVRTADVNFFPEWRDNLADLTLENELYDVLIILKNWGNKIKAFDII